MTIQLDPTRPIYLQLMEEIKRRTVRGEYAPGSQLPSVRDMAKEMEVNPNTIARVYRELEREGFIGSFAPTAYTLMGRIFLRSKLTGEMAPSLIGQLQAEQVDAALLVPV